MISSGVSAGKNITVTATGDSKQAAQKGNGDINLIGSEIKAGQDIVLNAQHDLNVMGAVNTQHSDKDEKSYGGAAGIQLQFGGDESGLRFKGNANFSREREKANGSAWSEGIIEAGNKLTVNTGHDTHVIGGQLKGDKVELGVGHNLNIESLQDTDNFDYEKISTSISGTYGTGASGNLSFSQTEMASNWASVTDQSGIFAGSGGYAIQVGNNTDLKGAVIASSAKDKTNNTLDTGTISFSDIENKADFNVSHVSISVGTSGASPTAGIPVVYQNSDSDHSTTHSAVEEGTLIIRDKDKQKQDIKDLSHDTEHANDVLKPIFDKQKELDRIDSIEMIKDIAGQVKDIAKKADRIAAQQDLATKKDTILSDAKKAYDKMDEGEKAEQRQQGIHSAEDYAAHVYYVEVDKQVAKNAKDNKNHGSMGGSVSKGIDAATSIVTGIITGDITGGLAGASAPYLAGVIKEQTQGNDDANLIAHAILGGVVAHLQGNNALAGAAGAAGGEKVAQIIQDTLYGGTPTDKLSEADKENISALTQLATGLATAVATSGNVGDIGTAVSAAENAVENNYLTVIPTPAGPMPVPVVIPNVNDVDTNKEIALGIEQALKNIGKTIDEYLNDKGEINLEAVKEVLSPSEQKRLDERLELASGSRPTITNVSDYLQNNEFGQILNSALTLEGYDALGKPIYSATGGAGNFIQHGDKISFTQDSIQVFDKNGALISILNLDGTQNSTLTDMSSGKQLSSIDKLANNSNDKDKQPENQLVSGGSVAVGGAPGLPPDDDHNNKDKSSTSDDKSQTTSNGYKVSNGSDKVIDKADLENPIVQSRINIQHGGDKEGWNHVLKRHFSGNSNASQFTISEAEAKSLIGSDQVRNVPISNTRISIVKETGLEKKLYERVITLDKNIGVDKFTGKPTNTMTILTDKSGNLITATPGRMPL